jgi:O-Antigen ligase
MDARVVSGIVVAVGIVLALLVGFWIGDEAFLPLLVFLGIVATGATLLILRERIWVLVPCFWSFTGKLGSSPFSVRELVVVIAFGVFVVFLALRVIGAKVKTELLDWLVLSNCGYLAVVFVRNPVGVSALGSGMVGGRPYIDSLIGFLAFIILTRATLGPNLARRLPFLAALQQIGASLLSALTHYIPSTVPIVEKIYSGVDTSEYILQQTGGPEGGANRVAELLGGAEAGLLALLGYFPPLTLLSPLRPLRFLCFAAVCIGFALAGFRLGVLYLAFAFVIAAYFRNGINRALIVMVAGSALIFALIAAQNAGFTLPATAQRALSFLPGNWNADAKADAEDSNEWRFYMWDVVIHTDIYIHNKLLGDGFGFTSYELQIMEQQEEGGPGFVGGAKQESSLIQGAFHSGPLSAVRYVGAVGLSMYLLLLVVAARYAWRLIVATRGTDFFPLALFIGIPAIYEPLQYIFIFGGFDSGFPNTLFVCGMLKLLAHGVENHRQSAKLHVSGALASGVAVQSS